MSEEQIKGEMRITPKQFLFPMKEMAAFTDIVLQLADETARLPYEFKRLYERKQLAIMMLEEAIIQVNTSPEILAEIARAEQEAKK